MNYIGIDNGVSGSIAVLGEDGTCNFYSHTPVIKCLNYTKAKAWIHRINHDALGRILEPFSEHECRAAIERPMVNPGRFKATVSALRALESTQLILERLRIPYQFVDSKGWQKALLPSGLAKDELKTASDEVCKRKFPHIAIKHPGDGDSLLIAEFLRTQNLR